MSLESRIQDLERKIRDKFKEVAIESTTNPTANTRQIFKHGLSKRPTRFYPVYGRVYVNEITETFIDVRSPNTSEKFKIIVL